MIGKTETSVRWKDFFVQVPPGMPAYVYDLLKPGPYRHNWELIEPSLELFCDSEQCDGIRFFDTDETLHSYLQPQKIEDVFLTYNCRNCGGSEKTYAIKVYYREAPSAYVTTAGGNAVKIGEYPPFGPRTPSRLNSLIGSDRELFFKGRRCESQGLGIGAFSYYRRVVENQKNRLIEDLIKVGRQVNADSECLAQLDYARKETQFSKAIDLAKSAIPQILFVKGQNPLKLLHTALSQGIHDQSDEDCLQIAISVRVVLSDLAERLEQVLRNESELNTAVSHLIQIQRQKKSGR